MFYRIGKKKASWSKDETENNTYGIESVVKLRKSDNYLTFPQYKSDGTVTSTILPAIFLPERVRSRPNPTNVRFPPIAQKTDKIPFKTKSRKQQRRYKTDSSLTAVRELSALTTSASDDLFGRRRSTKHDFSEKQSAHPKIIVSQSDSNNFSVKNIQEAQPGKNV